MRLSFQLNPATAAPREGRDGAAGGHRGAAAVPGAGDAQVAHRHDRAGEVLLADPVRGHALPGGGGQRHGLQVIILYKTTIYYLC